MITTIKRNFLTVLLAIALLSVPATAGDMGSGGFADANTGTKATSSSVTGDMGSGGFASTPTEDQGYLDWILGSIDEYIDWVR